MMTLLLRAVLFYLLITVSFVYTDTGTNNTDIDPRFDARISDLLAKNILQFAQELGTNVLKGSTGKTEVFSPLSVYATLSMLLMGSNQRTFRELMSLLKADNDSILAANPWKIHEEFGLMIEDLNRDSPNPLHRRRYDHWQMNPASESYGPHIPDDSDPSSFQRISLANGIFVQNGFSVRPDYRNAVLSVYNGTVERLDFEKKARLSTDYINRWANEKTEGKIKQLLPNPVDSSTKIVIASALYFKAKWHKRFLRFNEKQEFYPNGSDFPGKVMVDYMYRPAMFPFHKSREYDCRIIGIPYRHNLTTMFIILPNRSNRQRLRELQTQLNADAINDMISKMEWKSAILSLPKMHISNSFELRENLNEMGLKSLFTQGESDLSLISSGDSEFGRIMGSNHTARRKRSAVTYKASSSDFHSNNEPLRLKDLVLGKRITKSYPRKKHVNHLRIRRELFDPSSLVKHLDLIRTQSGLKNPDIFGDGLIHKVDLTVDENGTEGAAATAIVLKRSGPQVLFRVDRPFLILIRHDDTKLPLFYGAIFDPSES